MALKQRSIKIVKHQENEFERKNQMVIIQIKQSYDLLKYLKYCQRKPSNMGSFLYKIRGADISIDRELLGSSGSKLREYYSSYQSICQNFSINIPEYNQIFGPNVKSFNVWDPLEMGCINAIEMFSGLVIFSEVSYEEKVKFLYEIFDLNQEGFLCYQNLMFMFVTICDAVNKIYQIKDEKNENQVEEFLMEYFSEESQIRYDDFIRWSYRMTQFMEFFEIIGHKFTKKVTNYIIQSYKQTQKLSERSSTFKHRQEKTSEDNVDTKFLTYLKNDNVLLEETLEKNDIQMTIEEFNPSIQWIYGIRIDDIREPIHSLYEHNYRAANDQLVYICGKNVIIFFPKLNKQKHYSGHQKAVGCIEISSNRKVIASGEIGSDPTIHLWDTKTLKTIAMLQDIQKNSITAMKFMKNDELLVTVGQREKSPIIIVSIEKKQIVLSTYLDNSIIQIIPKNENSFGIVYESGISFFEEMEKNFKLTHYRNCCQEKEFESRQCVAINQSSTKIILIITKGGQFKSWNMDSDKFKDLVVKGWKGSEDEEVVHLTPSKTNHQFYLLTSFNKLLVGKLQEETTVEMKVITDVMISMYNLNLIYMLEVGNSELLVLSLLGDLIRLQNIHSDDAYIEPKKYFQVFKLQKITGGCIFNTNQILLTSSNLVYQINDKEHELIRLKCFDHPLTHIHACKKYYLIATNTKTLHVVHDGISVEKVKIDEEGKIQDLKITNDSIIVAIEQYVLFYIKQGSEYFQKEIKRIKVENYVVHIGLNSVPKIFLLMTKDRTLLKINHEPKEKSTLITAKELYSEYIETFYPQSASIKLPLLFSVSKKMFLVGGRNGQIWFWNSLQHALSSYSLNSKLSGHVGEIIQLINIENGFISIGGADGQIIMWKNKKTISDDSESEDEKKNIYNETKKIRLKQTTPLYTEQIESLKNIKILPIELRDSKLEVIVKDSEKYKDLTKIINKIIQPQNKHQFQTLKSKKNPNEQPLSLFMKLEHIYGFEAQKNRQSLFYVHFYQQKTQKHHKILDEKQKKLTSSQTMKEFQFSDKVLLPLDEVHQICKREFIYFCGRVAIISCPLTKKQKIYNFHRNQISCLTVHPDKQIICTCEIGNPSPLLHIWSINTIALMHEIPTHHYRFIYRVEFSRDGKYIVSLGGIAGFNSIQVHRWQDQTSIAYRIFQGLTIYDLKINPYNKEEFCIGGKQLLQILHISNKTLIIHQKAKITREDISCLVYSSSIYGNDIQSDIIVGTSGGDINIFICGKYIECRKKAHEKSINILKMCQLFNYKTVIISGSQDNKIKIWDAKLNEISCINVRDLLLMNQKVLTETHKLSFSVQSIDIYHCKNTHVEKEQTDTILLFGTRNGCIVEEKITNEYQGIMIHTEQGNELINEKVKLTPLIHGNNLPSGNSYNFDIRPPFMITYSSTLSSMNIWNIEQREFIKQVKLNNCQPSVVKFTNTNFLIAGMCDGKVEFYEIMGTNFNHKDLKPVTIAEHYPIKICCSENDRRIAIVYERIKHHSRYEHPNDDAHIIYVFDKILQGDKVQHRIINENKKMPHVQWLQFSNSSDKLIIFYVERSKGESIVDKKTECRFVVYDIGRKAEKELTDEDFNSLNFSVMVKACYHLYPDLMQQEENLEIQKEKKTAPAIITEMTQYEKYTLMGTSNGEIFSIPSEEFFFQEPQINVQGEESTFTKLYTCSSHPIKKMAVVSHNLYVSCYNTNGIYVYDLRNQHTQQFITESKVDIYSERIRDKQIENKIKSIFPKRKNAYECKQNQTVKEQSNQSIQLKLMHIYGRNALYKRNNIFMDLKGNIISYAGCQLIIISKKEKQEKQNKQNKQSKENKESQETKVYYSQEFVKLDNRPFSTNPEITAMTMSQNKRILYVGTTQENAQVIVWNLSTKTSLFQILLPNIIEVSLIKVSESQNHAVVLGLNREEQKFLLFLSLKKKKILGCHCCDKNWEIHDLEFFPNTEFKFLFCGSRIIGQAVYEGHLLTYENYSLQNPKDFMEQNHKASRLCETIFYSIIFLNETAITAGSDGFLCLWHDKGIIKKQSAHPKAAILSLFTSKNSKIFVSGAVDGKAIVWQHSSNSIIQKVFQFSTHTEKQHIDLPKYQIQSVCIGKNEIILGTRSGEIHQFFCTPIQEGMDIDKLKKSKDNRDSKDTSTQILSAFDDDAIVSCDFDISSQKLFVLTKSGVINLFNLQDQTKIKEHKIETDLEIVKMLTCKFSNKLFIILKNSIQIYQYVCQVDKNSCLKTKITKSKEQIKDLKQPQKDQQKQKKTLEIKDAILSSRENYLAILITPNQEENAKIQIYELSNLNEQYMIRENIPANIDIIDFSTDNGYLVYKNLDEDETIIDLTTKESINTDLIEFGIQWNEEAKKTSKYIRDICSTYSDENKLLKIAQIRNHTILVTDEMGSIRVFKYEQSPETEDHEISYEKFYLEHLNYVDLCVLNSNCRILVTVGRCDHSIFIWSIGNIEREEPKQKKLSPEKKEKIKSNLHKELIDI